MDNPLYTFAAAALTGMLANSKNHGRPEQLARDAWLIAHKMMECPARDAVLPLGQHN